MNANELIRRLRKLGATVEPSRGKGGHQRVTLNGRITIVPMHGKREIKTGTFQAILKNLGITDDDLS